METERIKLPNINLASKSKEKEQEFNCSIDRSEKKKKKNEEQIMTTIPKSKVSKISVDMEIQGKKLGVFCQIEKNDIVIIGTEENISIFKGFLGLQESNQGSEQDLEPKPSFKIVEEKKEKNQKSLREIRDSKRKLTPSKEERKQNKKNYPF